LKPTAPDRAVLEEVDELILVDELL